MSRTDGTRWSWAGIRTISRSQRAGAVAFLLGALLFGSLALYFADRDARLGPGAPVADATVIDVRSGKNSSVVVDFVTADGQRVLAQTEDFYWDPEPQAGDRARVRYDPEDPENYVRDERVQAAPWFVAMFASFAAAFLVASVLGWMRRLPRWVVDW